MWDDLVTNNFPTKKFFGYYSLNPYHILSKEIIERTADLGFPAKVKDFLLLRYSIHLVNKIEIL